MVIISSEKLSSSRAENSLYALTKRFFDYLKQTHPRSIDTNNLASFLCVSKRRVYDVTNILEGLGLLKKRNVNSLEWVGGDFSQFTHEKENIFNAFNKQKFEKIKKEDELDKKMLLELEDQEQELDQKISEINESVQTMLQQETSIKNAFVSNDDILNLHILQDKLVFVVKAPSETYLENKDNPQVFAIEMNTNNEKIDVFYISDEK